MSHHYYNQLVGDRQEVINACEQIITQYGTQFPDSNIWRETMLQSFSEECFWLASRAFDDGNTGEYNTLLKFAAQVYPKICNSSMWWRFKAKRFMGLTLWQKMRPALNHFRGIHETLPEQLATEHSQTSRLCGWWENSPELGG